MTFEVNQSELATILRVTTRQVRDLDIPSRLAGRKGRLYDLSEVVPLLLQRERERAKRKPRELLEAQIAKERLEVRRRQLEVAKAEGELITIDDHETVVGKIADAFRAAVLAIPGSWGPRLVGIKSPAEGTELMRQCGHELLRDMVRFADDLELRGGEPELIPGDFPGHRALLAAGIETMHALRALEDVTAITGIGPKLSARIRERLGSAA